MRYRSPGRPPFVGRPGLLCIWRLAARFRCRSTPSLREVMKRIGHSSTWAAMIYQDATQDRDRAIATALDALIRGVPKQDRERIWHGPGT
jgi:hypothetical protein